VTRPIVWNEHALNAAAGFLADDPQALRQLLDAVDQLGDDPRPEDSLEFGFPDLRRLRIGRYRVLYEISDVVTVIHVGQPA
jgi:mRNA interferase RelE/StbE